MRLLLGTIIGAAALAAAPAALAQSDDLTVGIAPDVKIPRAMPAAAMAQMAQLEFKHRQQQERTCFKTGCLILVNETSDYDAVGFFLDTGTPDMADAPVWSPNLLTPKLAPGTVRWTFKTGDRSMCSLAAMIVLRHRKSGLQLSTLGEASLCRSPKQDSAIRIRVVEPKVTIEEGQAGD